MARLTFAAVYPHYVTKVEKKGRTREELHQVVQWLTGFDDADIARHIEAESTFGAFFDDATLPPGVDQIRGKICGYRIEDIETPLTRQVRYLDKLVDELARGRAMEKILRS